MPILIPFVLSQNDIILIKTKKKLTRPGFLLDFIRSLNHTNFFLIFFSSTNLILISNWSGTELTLQAKFQNYNYFSIKTVVV